MYRLGRRRFFFGVQDSRRASNPLGGSLAQQRALIVGLLRRTSSVSVTFYGRRPDNTPVFLDIEDANWLNFSSANARAFLAFLRLDPGYGPDGEVTLPELRRAVIRARATFERRAPRFVRAPTETTRLGRCRVIVGGIDEAYFERRLGDFERFLNAVVGMGAVAIYWG